MKEDLKNPWLSKGVLNSIVEKSERYARDLKSKNLKLLNDYRKYRYSLSNIIKKITESIL